MNDKKRIVLIVDDDKDFRDILVTKLTKAGFEVCGAGDGEEGISMAQQVGPDLVVMDLEMPKMNGMEAFFKMKKDFQLSKLKVVFLTSYGDPVHEASWIDEKFARDIGAFDYIRKTDDLQKIVEEIRKILRVGKTG